MRAVLDFIYRFRATFLFFLLEIAAFLLIVSHNRYHKATFVNTSSGYIASLLSVGQSIESYFYLAETNRDLAEENARLHQALSQAQQQGFLEKRLPVQDSALIRKYSYQFARVVNKSTLLKHNYLTIERGSADGLQPDMGIISPTGIVGKIREVTRHYARVISILHTDFTIPTRLKNKSNYEGGYVQWDGKDARFTKLKDVPTPIKVAVGDTVVTSGFGGLFPQGVMIGIVARVGKVPEATFHDIDVRLSTDFNSLNYVYVIENKFKQEIDSLKGQP